MKVCRSRSRSPSFETPLFPLILAFPKNKFTRELYKIFENAVSKYRIDRIHVSSETGLESYEDGIVYIYGPSSSEKYSVVKLIFNLFLSSQEQPILSLKILVPDNIVGILTTKYGKHLHGLQSYSHATVIIYKQIPNLRERQIKLEGRSSDLGLAIKCIYSLIVESSHFSKPKSPADHRSVQFVIPEECAKYIIGKHGTFIKWIKTEFNVKIKVIKNEEKFSKGNEQVVILLGESSQVKKSLNVIIDRIIQGIKSIYSSSDLDLKMLIHKDTIKDFNRIFKDAARKSGTRINAINEADGDAWKLIAINGILEAKIDAAEKILDYITNGNS
ncbi:NOVA1 [Blepharisma stoltei]|uniref:K Homology domain-containing protein n=1 Tax=Blepharisma stoltei TaxID=1481888 RepID=A0AAU9IGZ0_9CILI|nr:unnamed protein product [Blepharisma stoltei]